MQISGNSKPGAEYLWYEIALVAFFSWHYMQIYLWAAHHRGRVVAFTFTLRCSVGQTHTVVLVDGIAPLVPKWDHGDVLSCQEPDHFLLSHRKHSIAKARWRICSSPDLNYADMSWY